MSASLSFQRITHCEPTDPRWALEIQHAKDIGEQNWRENSRFGYQDRDGQLCAVQRDHQRAGFTHVVVDTNIYGWCVRDTINDGLGTMFGGRARRGTTHDEALAWAREWHAEQPTHRKVSEVVRKATEVVQS